MIDLSSVSPQTDPSESIVIIQKEHRAVKSMLRSFDVEKLSYFFNSRGGTCDNKNNKITGKKETYGKVSIFTHCTEK